MNEQGTYYHQRRQGADSSAWTSGAMFQFGGPRNYYTERIETVLPTIKLPSGARVEIEEVLRQAVATYVYRAPLSNLDLVDYHFDPAKTLNEAFALAEYESRRIRELTFEQVRLLNYRHLPSRRTCIWLLPGKRDLFESWLKTYDGRSGSAVFEVTLEGRKHFADSRFLKLRHRSIEQWKADANDYWKGACMDETGVRLEILAEGTITVVRRCATVSPDGQITWI